MEITWLRWCFTSWCFTLCSINNNFSDSEYLLTIMENVCVKTNFQIYITMLIYAHWFRILSGVYGFWKYIIIEFIINTRIHFVKCNKECGSLPVESIYISFLITFMVCLIFYFTGVFVPGYLYIFFQDMCPFHIHVTLCFSL